MGQMPNPTITNPEFYENEEARDQVADAMLSVNELWSALPSEAFDLPEEGAWICVTDPPHTVIEVPWLSLWFAKPVYASRKLRMRVNGRRRWVKWPLLKAQIITEEGELHLWPGEYSRVRDITQLLDLEGHGLTLHFLGREEPPADLADRVFYMQTRGISRREALLVCLGDLSAQDFVYMTIDLEDADK